MDLIQVSPSCPNKRIYLPLYIWAESSVVPSSSRCAHIRMLRQILNFFLWSEIWCGARYNSALASSRTPHMHQSLGIHIHDWLILVC
jgi:hypothetical protein